MSLEIGNIWPKYWWINFGWEGLVMPLLLVIDTCGRFGHTRNKLRWGKERKTMKKGWKRQKGGIREKPRRIYFQYWEKIELYYPNYLDCTLIWIKFFLLFLVISSLLLIFSCTWKVANQWLQKPSNISKASFSPCLTQFSPCLTQ